jgi:hypothetical protein
LQRPTRIAALVLPSACLVAVGATQIWLSFTLDLTPWKGGGFGMFSTSDQPRVRFARVVVLTAQGTEILLAQKGPANEARLRAASLPVRSTAEPLAREAIEITRKSNPAVTGARIEIWKRDFDAATLRMLPRKVAEFVFDAGDSGDGGKGG